MSTSINVKCVSGANKAAHKHLLLCLVLFLALGCFTNVFAQIISNGGFEIPAIGTNGLYYISEGETLLPGWTIDSGEVFIALGVPGAAAYEGQQCIGFNLAGASYGGSLSQTFQTTLGQNYNVSFAVGGWEDSDGIALGVTVNASDNAILSSSNCVAPSSGWTNYQISFTATTPSTTLTFADGSSGFRAGTLGLDDVVVTPLIPVISVTNAPSGFILSWPLPVLGFHLQTAPFLGTNWVDYPGALITNASDVTVTVSNASAGAFFRLSSP